jgi:hypothetical protein
MQSLSGSLATVELHLDISASSVLGIVSPFGQC